MKQQWKQILVWLVVLIVVAATVYYFLTPAGPYLEGVALLRNAFPWFVSTNEGFSYSTAVPLDTGKTAIKGLYTIKNPGVNLTDASLNAVMLDVSNICPNTSTTTQMSKACFDSLVTNYSLSKTSLPSSYSAGISAEQAKIIMSVLNRQLGTSYSSLDAADVGYALTNDVDLSGLCAVSTAGTISVACYNKLLEKFATAPATTTTTSTAVSADTTTTTKTAAQVKKDRIDTFMAIADVAGYTDLDKDDVSDEYDDLKKSCGKTKASFDRECYNDLAKKLDITIFSSSSTGDDATTTKTTSTKTKSKTTDLSGATPTDVSGGSYSAKCTVQFGDNLVSPQTKASADKTTTTSTTTGDVAKTTKTPAVEQGCEFAQKFPKVNVINLRDYVHKDEIPCWSCKL
jgi:hypothetical protein